MLKANPIWRRNSDVTSSTLLNDADGEMVDKVQGEIFSNEISLAFKVRPLALLCTEVGRAIFIIFKFAFYWQGACI